MENVRESFDYEALKKKSLEQLRSGKSFFGKDGAFAPLLKDFLESALESELDAHLDREQRQLGNRRNGRNTIIKIMTYCPNAHCLLYEHFIIFDWI